MRRGMPFNVVSMVTEVEADPDDNAFKEPTKPIGRFYTKEESERILKVRNWKMVEDPHRGFRRVVPSPAPVRIVLLESIARLTDMRSVVICCGGGGIPVVRNLEGRIEGLEAVIDKDRVSALLGVRLGAKRLIITTGVEGIYQDFMGPNQKLLRHLTLDQLRKRIATGEFPAGSMGPKAKAAERFIKHGGEEVIICHPERLVEACAGTTGTRITGT